VVVYVPHRGGLASGARSPPKKCNSASSKGSCGLFLNAATTCPVSVSCTSPASFTSTPDTGSSATRYIAIRLPNGLVSCVARYTAPVNGLGSSGVLIVTVPIFDASEQKFTPSSNGSCEALLPGNRSVNAAVCTPGPSSTGPVKPTRPSEQACKPSAPAGLIAMPSGNVTAISFTSGSAKPAALVVFSCGLCTSTFKPVGVLAAVPSGVTTNDGSNGARLQPSN